jgi:hypothetical protein
MSNNIKFLVFMSEDHKLFYKVGFISFREFVTLAKENSKADFYFKISISGIIREDKIFLGERVKKIIFSLLDKEGNSFIKEKEKYDSYYSLANSVSPLSILDMPEGYFLFSEGSFWIHFYKERFSIFNLLSLKDSFSKKEKITFNCVSHIVYLLDNYNPVNKRKCSSPFFVKKDKRYYLIDGLSSLINQADSLYLKASEGEGIITGDVLDLDEL